MSGPVRPPLEVKESDDSVEVRPTNVISFDSSDFNITKSGTTATITTGGTAGTIGGSITEGQVAFGAATANSIEGEATFVYDKATSVAGLGIAAPLVYSANATTLQIHDATYPELRLTNDTTGSASGKGALLQVAGEDFYIWNAMTAKMHFATDGTVMMTLASAGKLGIGEQSPTYTLDVKTATDDTIARFQSGDANAGIIVDGSDDGYSVIFFAEDGSNKWSMGKLASASDTFSIYNEATSDAVLKIQADNDMIYNDGNDAATFYMKSSNEVALDIAGSNAIGASIALDATATDGDEWRLVSGASGSGIGGGNFGLYNVDASTYVWTAGEDGVVGIGAFPGTSAERLHVKGDGQTAPMVLIESEDDPGITGANPTLRLYNSSTPGMNLQGGKLEFSAQNDAGAEFVYGSIGMTIRDSTANEDGSLEIRVAMAGAEATDEYMRIGTATQAIFLNPGGVNIDTQISSENITAMLKVDAGNDNIGIGAAPDSGVERLEVSGTGTGTLMRLTSTDDGANNAPDLELFRDSPSPLSGDYTGSIQFTGYEDTAGTSKVTFGTIDVRMFSQDGAENGVMTLYTRQNNANRPQISLKASGAVFNENNEPSFDFQIETSGNTNTFFVNSGTDNVGIGGQPDSSVERLEVIGTGVATLMRLTSTDADANSAPELSLWRNSATSATDDIVGQIRFEAETQSSGIKVTAATFYTKLKAVSGDAVDAEIFCDIRVGNASKNMMKLGNTEVVFNDDSQDVDFRIESDDNVDMFKIDGNNNLLGVGAAPTAAKAQVQIDEDATFTRFTEAAHTANVDITPQMLHNTIQLMKATGSRIYATLPTVANTVPGMCMTIISNGGDMSVIGSGGEGQSINGTAASGTEPTAAFDTSWSRMELIATTTSIWVAHLNGAIATVTNS